MRRVVSERRERPHTLDAPPTVLGVNGALPQTRGPTRVWGGVLMVTSEVARSVVVEIGQPLVGERFGPLALRKQCPIDVTVCTDRFGPRFGVIGSIDPVRERVRRTLTRHPCPTK